MQSTEQPTNTPKHHQPNAFYDDGVLDPLEPDDYEYILRECPIDLVRDRASIGSSNSH